VARARALRALRDCRLRARGASSAMASDTGDHLYIRLADRLRRQFAVTGLRVGDRLPPLRTLIHDTGSSMPVVRKALNVLRHEGLIEMRHGQGTYLRRHASVTRAGLHRILLLAVGVDLEHDVSRALLDELARQAAFEQIEIGFEAADEAEAALRLVAARDPDVVILTGIVPRILADRLHHAGRRVIVSGDPIDSGNSGGFAEVRSNDRFAGYLAMQHLLALGHARIAVLASEVDGWWQRERIAGLRQAHEDAGGTWDPALVVVAGRSFQAMDDAAGRVLDLRPSAVVLVGYWFGRHVIAAAGARDQRVPQQLSIIAFDDAERERTHLTTVCCSQQDWASGLLLLAREQLADRPSRAIAIPRQLLLRGTTASMRTGRIADLVEGAVR
jgi:DNA-binding LacI/PurR family transcriptional regulator